MTDPSAPFVEQATSDGTLGWPADAPTDAPTDSRAPAGAGAEALTVAAESPAPRRSGWRRFFSFAGGGSAARETSDTSVA